MWASPHFQIWIPLRCVAPTLKLLPSRTSPDPSLSPVMVSSSDSSSRQPSQDPPSRQTAAFQLVLLLPWQARANVYAGGMCVPASVPFLVSVQAVILIIILMDILTGRRQHHLPLTIPNTLLGKVINLQSRSHRAGAKEFWKNGRTLSGVLGCTV